MFRLLNISIGAEESPIDLLVTLVETLEPELVLRAETNPLGHVLRHALELAVVGGVEDLPGGLAPLRPARTQVDHLLVLDFRDEAHERVHDVVHSQTRVLREVAQVEFVIFVQPWHQLEFHHDLK